jgi:CheY-like chemotaxis protein
MLHGPKRSTAAGIRRQFCRNRNGESNGNISSGWIELFRTVHGDDIVHEMTTFQRVQTPHAVQRFDNAMCRQYKSSMIIAKAIEKSPQTFQDTLDGGANGAHAGRAQRVDNKGVVLVVDDCEDIRFAFALVIKGLGCSVVEAVNGQVALQLLRAGLRPNLILLDLMMPVVDGWQTDGELAADSELCKIPTVVVSAFPERASELTRKLDVLKKPVSVATLQNMIRKYCVKMSQAHG